MKAYMINKTDRAIQNLMNLYSTGSEEKALREAIGLSILNPNSAEVLNLIASATFKRGRITNCLKFYDRALKIQPNLAEAHNNMGFVSSSLNEFSSACDSFKRAIILNPNYEEAFNNYGLALSIIGQQDNAVSCFKMSLYAYPDFFDALINLGIALTEIGREEEAILCFQKLLESKYQDDRIHHNFGIALYKVGKYKDAEKQFIFSELNKSKYYLLRCQFLRGDQKLFHRTLDKLIQNNEVHPMLGSLCDRASQRFAIKTKNPFCENPIENFEKIDLTKKYNFEMEFVTPVSKILNNRKLSFKRQKLLKNGRQTDGNLFLKYRKTLSGILSILGKEIEFYRQNPFRSQQNFIKKWPEKFKLLGWLITMENYGKLAPHIHDEGWLSGCLYINVPPKESPTSGNLVVCLDDDGSSLNPDKNTKKIIHVKTGDLCLFPASLLHYTIPFRSKEQRIVLAFDVVPS